MGTSVGAECSEAPRDLLGPRPSPLFSHPNLNLQASQGTPPKKSGPQVPLCAAAKRGPPSWLSSASGADCPDLLHSLQARCAICCTAYAELA